MGIPHILDIIPAGGKDKPTSFLFGNRGGHRNTQLRTYRHLIEQNIGHHYVLTYTTNTLRHGPSYTQLGVKTNRAFFLYGMRYKHRNTNVKTHNMTTRKTLKISNTDPTKNRS
jgi:hypothetical protein